MLFYSCPLLFIPIFIQGITFFFSCSPYSCNPSLHLVNKGQNHFSSTQLMPQVWNEKASVDDVVPNLKQYHLSVW